MTVAAIYLLDRSARAWWSGGHKTCAAASVKMLPDDMPEFFRNAAEEIA